MFVYDTMVILGPKVPAVPLGRRFNQIGLLHVLRISVHVVTSKHDTLPDKVPTYRRVSFNLFT